MTSHARFESLVCDEVDLSSQELFEVRPEIEIAGERGGAVECDKDIDVAIHAQFISRSGVEESEPLHSELLADLSLVLR